MVFSSLTFLQCFLPLCLLAYFLVPQKWRNGTLFLFSLLFYAWGEPVYVVLMLFSTVLDYTCGQMVERHRGQRGAKIALLYRARACRRGLPCGDGVQQRP